MSSIKRSLLKGTLLVKHPLWSSCYAHQVEDGNKMEQSINPQLDRRIRRFASRL